MHHGIRRLAIFFGGSFLLGAGFVAAACGTDNGTTAVPSVDSGGRDTGGKGRDTGDGTEEDSGEPGPKDGGADCGNVPKPQSSDGPYCFSVADASADGGTAPKNCDSDNQEVCCSGGRLPADAGFEPSRCERATADNTNGGYRTNNVCQGFVSEVQQWHCTEKSHCPGNDEVCCAIPSDAGAPMPGRNNDFPGCDVFFQSGRFVGGTRCKKTECQAGDQQLCASDAECKVGKCVPLTIAGRYAGYCRLTQQQQ